MRNSYCHTLSLHYALPISTFSSVSDALVYALRLSPVHATKVAVPSVPLLAPLGAVENVNSVALDGSATPSVSDIENPSSVLGDVFAQNLPKFSPLPGLVELDRKSTRLNSSH